jgi:hypothetical protein
LVARFDELGELKRELLRISQIADTALRELDRLGGTRLARKLWRELGVPAFARSQSALDFGNIEACRSERVTPSEQIQHGVGHTLVASQMSDRHGGVE